MSLLLLCALASADDTATPAAPASEAPAAPAAPTAPAAPAAPSAPTVEPVTPAATAPAETVAPTTASSASPTPPPAVVSTGTAVNIAWAEEPRLEADFELGTIAAPDATFDAFSEADSLSTLGLRVGYRVMPRLTVLLDWQHGSRELRTWLPTDGEFVAAFSGDQIGLGAKGDLRVNPWFYPYVTAQGVLLVAGTRLDDDLDHNDNLSQTQANGVGGGIYSAVGMEFRIPMGSTPAMLAPYAEGGYGYLAPANLGEAGAIGFSGFTGRLGLGVRL